MIKDYLRSVSISNKIVVSIILFASITYFLASSIFLIMNKSQYESSMLNQLSTLSDFMGDDAAPALLANDKTKLNHLLLRLSNNPYIVSAEIYGFHYKTRIRYLREGDNSAIEKNKIRISLKELRDNGSIHFYKNNLLYLSKPIYYDYNIVGVFNC